MPVSGRLLVGYRLNLTVQPTMMNGVWEMVTSLSRTLSWGRVARSMLSMTIEPVITVSIPNNVDSKELFPLIYNAVEGQP